MYFKTRKDKADEITYTILEKDIFRDKLLEYVESGKVAEFINSLEDMITARIEKMDEDIKEYGTSGHEEIPD